MPHRRVDLPARLAARPLHTGHSRGRREARRTHRRCSSGSWTQTTCPMRWPEIQDGGRWLLRNTKQKPHPLVFLSVLKLRILPKCDIKGFAARLGNSEIPVLAFFGHSRTSHFFIRGGSGAVYGFVGAFLLKRAVGDCMVRVHCSKDTLDAHARSDVVLRSRKVVKSITAHIGDRAIRAFRKPGCSAAPASRASKPDTWTG